MKKERDFIEQEKKWKKYWEDEEIYKFSPQKEKEIYSIDTPPPTLSGRMHIGHASSYTQMDITARYRRMRGDNVFYPFGTDDNGIPTEKLVEKENKVKIFDMERTEFADLCEKTIKKLIPDFVQDWKDIGTSCDYSLGYSTIDSRVQRISQLYFLDLYKQGRAYRKEGPTVWCPLCQTAISQAELEDKKRDSVFYDITFETEVGEMIIATTRPELLISCVSIFVHPEDKRYKKFIGKKAKVPFFGQEVGIMEDSEVDPEKGSGAVMCCTFGDVTDIEWYYAHNLPLRCFMGKDGKFTEGDLKGLSVEKAREKVIQDLGDSISKREDIIHTVNVHERCGTAVEIIPTDQWFIKYLDLKEEFLRLGDELSWTPQHFKARYDNWVKGLRWDWCISRQRYFGIPFPVWHCTKCGKEILADKSQLPVDPLSDTPQEKCCGEVVADRNVLDTWATSSLTPQIVQSLTEEKVFPMSLRPQAHDIISFWLFNTVVRSKLHFDKLPWKKAVISGFILDEKGEKMSKSKGNVVDPRIVISNYGADALRYWVSSVGFGEDIRWSEKEINTAKRTLNKIWSASSFSIMHLEDHTPDEEDSLEGEDKWMLSKLSKTLKDYRKYFDNYEYEKARKAVDLLFWDYFCGHYIEMVKARLYEGKRSPKAARYTIYHTLLNIIKLYAPFVPFITEEIYQEYFRQFEKEKSIHLTLLPENIPSFDEEKEMDRVAEVVSSLRKYKTENSIPMGQRIEKMELKKGKEVEKYVEVIKDTLKIDNIHFI